MIILLFWTLDIKTTAENFLWMIAYGVISNTTFCAQGYLLGILFENEEVVKLVNGLVVMIFVSSNGVMVNIA